MVYEIFRRLSDLIYFVDFFPCSWESDRRYRFDADDGWKKNSEKSNYDELWFKFSIFTVSLQCPFDYSKVMR